MSDTPTERPPALLLTTDQLLLIARRALGHALDLHLTSVRIGQLEGVAETGVLDVDALDATEIMEQMDRACALIDRHRAEKRKTL